MLPPLTLCAYMKKGPNLRWSLIQCSGGDEGVRTPDLLTASQALSQLSYAPVRRSTIRELPRRCKDKFGKSFCNARGARGHRGPPFRDPTVRPAGSMPRNRGIYYVWAPAPSAARTKPAYLLPLGGTLRPHRCLQNKNRR